MYKFVTSDIKMAFDDANAQKLKVQNYFGQKVRFCFHPLTSQTVVLSPDNPQIDMRCSREEIPEYKNGEKHTFRIKINAAVKDRSRSKNGLRALVKNNEMLAWFEEKALKNGFKASVKKSESLGFLPCIRSGGNKGDSFPIYTVYLQGSLEIIDQDLFNNAVITGIGHEKTFGLGLLDIID